MSSDARACLADREVRSITVNAELHVAGTVSNASVRMSGTVVQELYDIPQGARSGRVLLCREFAEGDMQGVVDSTRIKQ